MVDLSELENKIGIKFKNKNLLINAFVHRSYLNENKTYRGPSYEKLEFLGDSVLSLITSVHLYKGYPALSEGQYTDIKAYIVKTESLWKAARELNLGKYLRLSKGEIENRGRESKSIPADCFEALIGAIYLDQGYDQSYKFVDKFLFRQEIDKIIKSRIYQSSKNKLQELIQEKYKSLPVYKVVEEAGPEHRKKYKIAVYFKGRMLGSGEGESKKGAEEKAAAAALQKLKF